MNLIYALSNETRVEATPGARAVCPACGDIVIAKCGDIKQWHWAHKSNDCDPWYEAMTAWHSGWQSCFPSGWREIVIRKDTAIHRADVQRPDGVVVEFQHSSISVEDIRAREKFYGHMIWLFDAREAVEDGRIEVNDRNTHHTFRWKHPKLSIAFAYWNKYLDLGNNEILEVRKMYKNTPCHGWGDLMSRQEFLFRIGATVLTAIPA